MKSIKEVDATGKTIAGIVAVIMLVIIAQIVRYLSK